MILTRWRQWMARIGPGAIVASLTIGSGELVFSSRAGSLFGYHILFVFLLICLLKWVLIYTTGRQIIITGQHPLESWNQLPGPAGWLPMTFLVLAVPCFPIWIAFHASTVGTLLAHLTDTSGALVYVWASGVLGSVVFLSLQGNYQKLERFQMIIVGLMLVMILFAVVLLKPDWFDVAKGMMWPGTFQYPDWIDRFPSFEDRPVWVELTTYVGIVGGSSYDYLCYVAFIREKGWGNAAVGCEVVAAEHVNGNDIKRNPRVEEGLRNLRWDSVISFACVFLFSVVFVICGHLVLAPQQMTPTGGDLLTVQAVFVSDAYPGLRVLYFAGAFLAMYGTLYGTLEVGPTIVKEMAQALRWKKLINHPKQWRQRSLIVFSTGAFLVILALFTQQIFSPDKKSIQFVWILTPANLFTGVMGCGLILISTLWVAFVSSKKNPGFLAKAWIPMMLLGAVFFIGLGLKGYWDHSGLRSLMILASSIIVGVVCAKLNNRRLG